MGTLRDRKSGEVWPLPARLLVGRAPACGLRLSEPTVSGEHARISWSGRHWALRDLGSRNGTFVDGERLESGAEVPLKAGTKVAFGDSDDRWMLTDDGAPSAIAEQVGTRDLRLAEDGLLALPDADHPECTLYLDARGIWVCERPDQPAAPIANEALVHTATSAWKIRLPEVVEGTATLEAGFRLEALKLRFSVSRNEEHVHIALVHRGTVVSLEPREHGYVLLTLARARLDESDQPLAEQGWIDRDQLLKMLAMDANAMNVSIYRARGQLSAAGVEGAAGVVEVRRGQRRIGIEPDRLEVVRL